MEMEPAGEDYQAMESALPEAESGAMEMEPAVEDY
jgi:hypothetical protein